VKLEIVFLVFQFIYATSGLRSLGAQSQHMHAQSVNFDLTCYN